MPSDPVIFSISDNVAILTLNRPNVLNAIDFRMLEAMYDHLIQLNEKHEIMNIRALIITGSGKAFSAGGDVKVFADYVSLDQGSEFIRRFNRLMNGIIVQLREAHFPVIASLNGIVSGAGLNLACACDFRVASHSAMIQTAAYTNLGLIPASGGSFLIPAIVGPAKAWELFTWKGLLTSTEAMDIGLISQVYPDDKLEEEAMKLAFRLALGPTLAFMRTKELINNYLSGSTLDHHLNLELKFQKEMAKTKDFKEGINAFLEKRMAQFEGK